MTNKENSTAAEQHHHGATFTRLTATFVKGTKFVLSNASLEVYQEKTEKRFI
mgnify:CR=1 FL=1